MINKIRTILIGKISYVDPYSKVGKNTYVGYNCFVTNAQIGSYCSLANNVSIGPGEHDFQHASTSSIFYEEPYEKLTEKTINIGNDVWIGVNSVVRRGVNIGNGAVIGANSFVNTNVPKYAIFAGNPARLIKMRFSESTIEKIEKSNWWNLDKTDAKKMLNQISESTSELKEFEMTKKRIIGEAT